ncbi:MAG: hypothetical protein MZV65_47005 [Chromatiales bacterium]|nr:hypothetical protein [Chromatiales bacterium]
MAAKIAIGHDAGRDTRTTITGKTFAAFEPTIDYVVAKIPRWPFDKFRTADTTLGTQMKSHRRGHVHRPHHRGVADEGRVLVGNGPHRP